MIIRGLAGGVIGPPHFSEYLFPIPVLPCPQASLLRSVGAEFQTEAAVIESAGPSGATLKLLQDARREMGLEDSASDGRDADQPTGGVRLAAARCWALLLTRIFECLPLRCPKCGEPMRIFAFVLDQTGSGIEEKGERWR